MVTALETELRAELMKIEEQRRAMVEGMNEEYVGLPTQWRHTDGTYVMVPLIQARSNILLALAILKGNK